VYTASIDNGVGPDYSGGMFFSTNKENISSFKIDLSYHLKELLGIKSELKLGSMVQNRNRTFDARQLGYTTYGNGSSIHFKDSLKYLDQNAIFNSENMGLIKPGVGGFKLTDASKYSDAYTANSSTTSGYLMVDNKIHKTLRLVWGARAEYFVQNLHAIKSDKSDLQIATKKLDVLPSLNAIYSFHKKQNFRFSFSQTLNRPEYRELAPFAFYDFNTQFVISGNDSLKRAKITNLDLRYELYPGKGQLLSGTFFYKQFENPIEQISRADVANEMSFKNVPKATNFGFEIEARTIIGSLLKADSSSITNNFTFYTNLAIIRSIVDVSDIVGTPYTSRPLQGQSPYVFNTGLTYFNEDKNLSASINVNRVGDRIAILGNINQPDIWEKSRTFLDFQVSKGFFKNKMECKLNVQNILAQKQIFYQNNYTDNSEISTGKEISNLIFNGTKRNINGFNDKVDNMIWSTVFGRTISATITIKL
jgi:outer membrane receptor protein involved in Fe transport